MLSVIEAFPGQVELWYETAPSLQKHVAFDRWKQPRWNQETRTRWGAAPGGVRSVFGAILDWFCWLGLMCSTGASHLTAPSMIWRNEGERVAGLNACTPEHGHVVSAYFRCCTSSFWRILQCPKVGETRPTSS